MKEWVALSFKQCENEDDKDWMERQLQTYCGKVIGDGSAYTINWHTRRLFRYNMTSFLHFG